MSSYSPSNSLGLLGVSELPSLNVQAPPGSSRSAGERAGLPLGSSASDPQGLAQHPPAHRPSLDRPQGAGLFDARNSTESGSPSQRGRQFGPNDSPKLRPFIEGFRSGVSGRNQSPSNLGRAPASDPGHGTNASDRPNRGWTSPRWPRLSLLHPAHSRQEPFLPTNPYATRFKAVLHRPGL